MCEFGDVDCVECQAVGRSQICANLQRRTRRLSRKGATTFSVPRFDCSLVRLFTCVINQSINQSVNQSINQSISQSVNQSFNQSINQSVSQSFVSRKRSPCTTTIDSTVKQVKRRVSTRESQNQG